MPVTITVTITETQSDEFLRTVVTSLRASGRGRMLL